MNGEDKLCKLTKNWDQSIFDGFRTGVEDKEWHIDRRKDFRAPGKEKPVFKGRDR